MEILHSKLKETKFNQIIFAFRNYLVKTGKEENIMSLHM